MAKFEAKRIVDEDGTTLGTPMNPLVVNTEGVAYIGYEAKSFTIGAETNYDIKVGQTLFASTMRSVTIKVSAIATLKINATSGQGIILAAGEQITVDKLAITNMYLTTTGSTDVRIISFT